MRGIILGSGIVGLLAKEILGDNWTIVPYTRSRFYSFKPALADNFVIRDDRIDDFIQHYGAKPSFIYKTLYSLGGALHTGSQPLTDAWLGKTFGSDVPPHLSAYMRSRDGFFIYDLRINVLYERLQAKYQASLQEQCQKGQPTAIGEHQLTFGDKTVEFDHLVSTIPLNKLLELTRANHQQLPVAQIWYYHIETTDLSFEGANQVLVVDDALDFFKVSNIAKDRYLFYFLRNTPIPGPYFMQFMQRFEIIDGTTISDALPKGAKPDLTWLDKMGVHCVGAFAEWDSAADVGSSMMRLLKYKALWSS